MNETTMTAAQVQGIFGDMTGLLSFLRSPIFKDLMALVAAFRTPDKADDKAALKQFLIDVNAPQMADLVEPLFDFISTLIDQFSAAKNVIPDEPIRVGAAPEMVELKVGDRKPISEITTEEAATWFAERKGTIREASKNFFINRVMKHRCPDILGAVDGTATKAQLAALTPDQIIRGLNIAIMVCTGIGMFYPPALVIATLLKFVLARYEANHPDVGLALSDLVG